MYLANTTRPDIAFSVNLLARISANPTMRQWKGIIQVIRYLKGNEDLGLFNSRSSDGKETRLIEYADAGYLSDINTAKSQSGYGYVFLFNGTAVSWRSTKQKFTATSSNHSKVIALHEASKECYWLRSLFNCITKEAGFATIDVPTPLMEDNNAFNNVFSNSNQGSSRATRQSICHLSYSGLMNDRNTLTSERFNLATTLLIYSQSHYPIQSTGNSQG